MTTQELYELLSKQITEMDARFTKQLETLDSRLRNVEVDAAEIKGRKAGWESALNFGYPLVLRLLPSGSQ